MGNLAHVGIPAQLHTQSGGKNKYMKKLVTLLALVSVFGIIASGCGNKDADTTAPAAGAKDTKAPDDAKK